MTPGGPCKLFITRDGKNLSMVLLVSPGGPWKGFSCYQIPLINLYGMVIVLFNQNIYFNCSTQEEEHVLSREHKRKA